MPEAALSERQQQRARRWHVLWLNPCAWLIVLLSVGRDDGDVVAARPAVPQRVYLCSDGIPDLECRGPHTTRDHLREIRHFDRIVHNFALLVLHINVKVGMGIAK